LDTILSQTLEHDAYLMYGKPDFFKVKRSNLNTQAEISYLFDTLWLAPHSQSGIYWQSADYKFIDETGIKTSEQQEVAAYSELNFHLEPRLTFVAGGRWAMATYDLPPTLVMPASQPHNTALATNLALNFDATKAARLFLRRATSYRFPKVDEQVCTLTGEPLATQRGISYEGGINYAKSPFKILAEIYRLLLHDEIISIPVKDSKYGVFNENLDPTKRDGALVDTTIDLARWGQLTIGGNHVISKFTTGAYQGKKMPFISENSCHLAEDFAWHEHWHFILEGIFNSSRYPINDVENRTPALGGFTIYNLGLGYEQAHYDISLRINNVTDKHYYGYVTAKYTGKETELGFYPATGVSTFISVNIRF
jgi:iron complex outermembrane recepter protein